MTNDDITVRTQIAELRADARALRERIDARSADSLRRYDQHAEDDQRQFGELRSELAELRKDVRAMVGQVAELAKDAAVSSARSAWLVGAIVGGLGFVGTVAVTVLDHLWM